MQAVGLDPEGLLHCAGTRWWPCTAAPVCDDQGRLKAVLDISTLTSPAGKESQHLALQMVKMLAAHVENASFLQRLREHWVQRLSRAPQFLEVSPEYLLAPDAAGRVVGHKRQARLLLEGARGLATVIGRQLLDLELHQLGLLVPTQAVEQHAAALPASRDTVLLLASPPPVRLAAPTLDRLIERAARPVRSPVNILLTGETGSGK
jgi:transcriptional regulator of acetoin/glycerol metabolism